MPENMDEKFMRLALDQARLAFNNGWIPVGAVFVSGGRIVAHGTKSGLTHTLFDHAEHNGCYQALWSREGPRNLRDFTVYSTLEPCFMCLSMLMTARISRIVYACEDPYGGGGSLLREPQHLPPRYAKERPLLEQGPLREESRELLKLFFLSQAGEGGSWSDPENPLVKLALS